MADLLNRIIFENYLNIWSPPRVYQDQKNYFSSLDEKRFQMRFRLSKMACLEVLELIEDQLEYPSDRNHPLSPINQLLLTLRFYATGSHLLTLADFSGVSTSTAHRVIHKVSHALANLRREFIKFPSTPEEMKRAAVENYQVAKFPQCIGLIDGTHVKLQSPGGDRAERYRNRKGYFSLNIQAIGNSNLEFLDLVTRWPGSAHDTTIFNASFRRVRFEEGAYDNYVLLGDSGYPLTKNMMTPLDNPLTQGERLYNESQIRTRNCIERMFGVWKRRFPILALGIRVRLDKVFPIITATAVLHNILRRANEDLPDDDADLELPFPWDELLAQGDIPTHIQPTSASIRPLQQGQAVRTRLINYFSQL